MKRRRLGPTKADMNSGEGKVVCVTGGSGFIGSYLVSRLLRRGYAVRATVRNLVDPDETAHLQALEGADKRLSLFEAELLDDGAFDSAIDGCEGVFHTASPNLLSCEDPQKEFVDPAVKGTLNVLKSCVKNRCLRRVVVTSSMSAVLMNDRPVSPEVTVDETWFSDPDCSTRRKSWYALSKTLAEDLAWKFAREKGIDLVTINPARVIGPLLQPNLNTSCSRILNLVNGAKTYDNASSTWVHIDDVVEAHIRAFEIPSANGRYCLTERVAHFSEIVRILKELYPNVPLPERCADNEPHEPVYKVAKDKVKSLGIDYIPIEVGLKDTVESFRKKGFVSF